MRQELRLVRRHVGMRRAIALATLASQAQVEGFAHFIALPLIGDHFAAQHFGQQARAAARGVALFAGDAIARAHGATFRSTTLAHADTAFHLARKALTLARQECHARGEGHRLVIRALAQVLVGAKHFPAGRIDHLARIHFSQRVPDGLEFDQRLHQLRSVHHRQELGLGLAVAVLARERAAVFDHQLGRRLQKTAPDFQSV